MRRSAVVVRCVCSDMDIHGPGSGPGNATSRAGGRSSGRSRAQRAGYPPLDTDHLVVNAIEVNLQTVRAALAE